MLVSLGLLLVVLSGDASLQPDGKPYPPHIQRMKEKIAARAAERRAAEDAEAQKHTAIVNDAALMHPALSALICHSRSVRMHAAAEIKREQKYARQGAGVVDKAKLYELQQKLREADEATARGKEWLSRLSLRPLPCSQPQTAVYAVCMGPDAGESCTTEIKGTISEIDPPWFWGEN